MRQLPAVQVGKERPGAKQPTGGIAGKRNPPSNCLHPSKLCSYTAANLEKGRQLWGAPVPTLWETLETNTDQRETPSCIHSWGCLPLLKREGHVALTASSLWVLARNRASGHRHALAPRSNSWHHRGAAHEWHFPSSMEDSHTAGQNLTGQPTTQATPGNKAK